MISLFSKILRRFQDQRGSASLEFVALAIPLFIPLFIYLAQYSTQSDLEASMRTLAREMARAVVTSENNGVAENVAQEVFIKAGSVLGLDREIDSGDLTYEVICRNSDCISPDNEIQIILHSSQLEDPIRVVEYVSPWA
jgi:hypothetical protein